MEAIFDDENDSPRVQRNLSRYVEWHFSNESKIQILMTNFFFAN